MFFVWDCNHRLYAWLPYIKHLHDDEPSWHIFVDSVFLNTFHGLVELLTVMMELIRYVFDPSFFS
jgi:hypothetical protein